MLRVYYSNHLERLVDGLVETLDRERTRQGADVFVRPKVAVPSWHLETYLQFELARRQGIAARAEYLRLRELFASLVPSDEPVEVLSDEMLQHLCVVALGDSALLESAPMQPVRSYLRAAGDEPDAVALRRFQLGVRIAQLFGEYDFNRLEMVARWPDGLYVNEPRLRRIEQWQRALWLHIFGDGGRLAKLADQTDTQYLRLAEIFDRYRPEALDVPGQVHLFAMSKLGHRFEQLLGTLGEHTEVHIWSLNPCREFWEDVVTDLDQESELLSSRPVDDGQLELTQQEDEPFWQPETFPPPLRLWGRVGRDQMRMFNRLCNHAPQYLFEDPIEEKIFEQINN